MLTLYGINNCQTVQKARKWLENNLIEYTFYDFKKSGVTSSQLSKWCDEFGYETVLNKSGMMWKKTPDSIKSKVVDQESAIEYMITTPTSIKRPIIEYNEKMLLGFDVDEYVKVFL